MYLLYTSLCTGEQNAIRKHKCFPCSPFYGRACRWAMLGELKPKGPKAADPDYWKGEVFAYVGSIQNLKDLKDQIQYSDMWPAHFNAPIRSNSTGLRNWVQLIPAGFCGSERFFYHTTSSRPSPFWPRQP